MFKAIKYGMRKVAGGLTSVCFMGFALFAISTAQGETLNIDDEDPHTLTTSRTGDVGKAAITSTDGNWVDVTITDGIYTQGNGSAEGVKFGNGSDTLTINHGSATNLTEVIVGDIDGGDGVDTLDIKAENGNFEIGGDVNSIKKVENIWTSSTGSNEITISGAAFNTSVHLEHDQGILNITGDANKFSDSNIGMLADGTMNITGENTTLTGTTKVGLKNNANGILNVTGANTTIGTVVLENNATGNSELNIDLTQNTYIFTVDTITNNGSVNILSGTTDKLRVNAGGDADSTVNIGDSDNSKFVNATATTNGIVGLALINDNAKKVTAEINNTGGTLKGGLGASGLNITGTGEIDTTINGGTITTTTGPAIAQPGLSYTNSNVNSELVINGGTIKGVGISSGILIGGTATGNFTINGGTIDGDLGSGITGNANVNTIVVNGGEVKGGIRSFELLGGNDVLTINGGTIGGLLDGGADLDTLNLSLSGTLANNITSFETINKTGASTLELSGALTGLTTLNAQSGFLNLNTSSDLSATSANVDGALNINQATTLNTVTVNNTGILNVNENLTLNRDSILNGVTNVSSSKTLDLNNNNLTVGADLNVNGNLNNVNHINQSNGIITLNTATDLSGSLTQVGGSLIANEDLTIGADSTIDGNVTIAANKTLDVASNNLVIDGDLTVNGFIDNMNDLTQTGSGTVTLENAQSFGTISQTTNNTLTTNNVLTLTGDSTVTGTIDGAGSLSAAGDIDVQGTLGVGTLTQTGIGTVTLANASSLGTLEQTSNNILTTNDVLTLTGDSTILGTINGAGSLSAAGDIDFQGTLGVDTLTQTGTGTVTLANATTLDSLTQTVNNTLTTNDVLTLTGDSTVTGTIDGAGSLSAAGNIDFQGTLGVDTLTQTGTGTVTLANATTLDSLSQTVNNTLTTNDVLTLSGNSTVLGTINGAGGLLTGSDIDFQGTLEVGTLTQTGTGTVTLANATTLGSVNQAAGSTLVLNGDLTLGADSTIDGSVTLTGNIINFSNNGLTTGKTFTLDNTEYQNISDLTQTGTGTITLANATTFDSLTQTINNTLTTNDVLTLTGDSTVTGTIDGAGSLSAAGDIDVQGTLGVDTLTQTGTGTVTLANATTLGTLEQTSNNTLTTNDVLTLTGDSTVTGTIDGIGTLSSSGNLTVDGTLSTAHLAQTAGTIDLNSDASYISFIQNQGALLNVNKNLNMTGNSDISGTMNIKEDWTVNMIGSTSFKENSKLQLNYKNSSDKISNINATGDVIFYKGAKIEVENAAAMTENKAYTVVKSNNTLKYNDGSTKNVAGKNDLDSIIDLSGNLIMLDLIVIGANFNELQFIISTSEGGDTRIIQEMKSIQSNNFNILNSASASDLKIAMEQMTNSYESESVDLLVNSSNEFMNLAIDANPIAYKNSVSSQNEELEDIEETSGIKGWFQVYGTDGSKDSSSKKNNTKDLGIYGSNRDYQDYNFRSYGLAVGAEVGSDRTKLGLAFGKSDIDINADYSNIDIENYQLALYGGYEIPDVMFFEGAISYAFSDIDMSSNNIIEQFSTKADTDANVFGLKLAVGKELELYDNLQIIPKIGLAYNHYEQDSYKEKGGIGREFDNYSKHSLVSDLGITAKMKFGAFTPRLSFAWLHEFYDDETHIDYKINGGSNKYSSYIRGAEEDRFRFGLGTDINLDAVDLSNANISLDYSREFSSDYKSDYLNFTFSYDF